MFVNRTIFSALFLLCRFVFDSLNFSSGSLEAAQISCCDQPRQGPSGPQGAAGTAGATGPTGPAGPTGGTGVFAAAAYGEIFNSSTLAQSVPPLVSVPYTLWSANGDALNTTPIFAAGTIVIANPGLYLVSFDTSITTGATTADFTFQAALNATPLGNLLLTIGQESTLANVKMRGLVRTTAINSVLSIRVSQNTAVDQTITSSGGNLNVVRIE